MNTLAYKGYQGRFEYDSDADIFHGEVLHLNDVVTFQCVKNSAGNPKDIFLFEQRGN